MEDRLISFLTLCRELSYRKTAEALYLTQPAITKQIQSLEREYGVGLVTYDGRKVSITPEGRMLEKYVEAQTFQEQELRRRMHKPQMEHLRIGATRSVGDCMLTPYLTAWLRDSKHSLSLTVDNTKRLLTMLDAAELDFAVIEGFFDKQEYEYRLLTEERFVGICARSHEFAGREVTVEEMREQTLLIRENGSGTRTMLERALDSLGESLSLFSRVITASSLHVINDLAAEGIGVSFVYNVVAKGDDRLATFSVKHMQESHEFHAVWLSGTNGYKTMERFLKV